MSKIKCGTFLSEIPFNHIPIIFKNSGMDFFILDCEHGPFDFREASQLVMVSKLTKIKCYIRVPSNDRNFIIKFMDMGADGIILPMTNQDKDILQVVEYAKYMPIGRRGISTTRAHTNYNPAKLSDVMILANKNTQIFAQIETVEGVQNLDSILSVDGVDGVFIGPNDLSADLNCLENPKQIILEKIKQITAKTIEKNKIAGVITTSIDYINECVKNGGTYISYGSELNMIKDSSEKIVKLIKK